jgi:hypothetical protein
LSLGLSAGKRLLYEADHVEPIRGIQRSVVASATVSGVLGEAVPKLACMCRWRAQDWAAVVALKDELGPFSFVFVTFRWKNYLLFKIIFYFVFMQSQIFVSYKTLKKKERDDFDSQIQIGVF